MFKSRRSQVPGTAFTVAVPADFALTARLNAMSSSFEELHRHYLAASRANSKPLAAEDYLVGSVYKERIRAANNKPPLDGEEDLRSAVVSLAGFSEETWRRNLSFFEAHLLKGGQNFPGFILLYTPPARSWEGLSVLFPVTLPDPVFSPERKEHRRWLKHRFKAGVPEVRVSKLSSWLNEEGAVQGAMWGVEFPELAGE